MGAARKSARSFILVLAGVNGTGKSSLGGAMLAEHGLSWFNPDTYARELIARSGPFAPDSIEANAHAWHYGRSRLEKAIANGSSHAFETTLGGKTITDMLVSAAGSHDVKMIFCGLSSVEQHIERVRLRVMNGGHDIPTDKIRERWVTSRANLIRLLPVLSRLQVFDNSAEAAPGQAIPDPLRLLDMVDGRIVYPDQENVALLQATPYWARPIVQAAIEQS